ncbi:hypothetical protein N0V93_002249 [Gnomoniopsis smithogilvyi]|uniref:Seipin n=1 Tax=Gnomoniopsis smithogilvyi TaxID=1191159 RepID=A0A9W9CYW4_9PEZI|nr:hypothetical protein N0V93_002249 [Gnomoniopsis smithogilvyi]
MALITASRLPIAERRVTARESATFSNLAMHETGKMDWPCRPVSEEVDEKPWATLGSSAEVAGVSLELSDHPWHADDVGPGPSSPNLIPARHPHHPHLHLRLDARDNNIAPTTVRANNPTPVRLLWPAGPSPLASPSLSTPWHFHTAAPQLRSSWPNDLQAFLPTCASTRTAVLELLIATRRTMEYLNDAGEYARTSYNIAVQTAGSVGRALTSKTAQRTLVTTVLFSLVSVVLFAVACVGYLAFYHNYLPDQVVSLPVHLQYGYALNPYGVVSLADTHFAAYQDYDISLTLHLPRSPANVERGNFMLALHLLDDAPAASTTTTTTADAVMPAPTHILQGHNILYTSTRPAIVPYTDPLVSLASRMLFLAYHIFVPTSETVTLTVPLVEKLEFRPVGMHPTWLVVDVQAGQTLQVYRAMVTITAQLSGLRWFMHTWWMTSFMLFTISFYLCEVFFFVVSFAVLRFLVFGHSSSTPSDVAKQIKSEHPQQQQQQQQQHRIKKEVDDDVPMTFPTASGQLPLRYEPAPPAETTGGDLPPSDLRSGEADDEYEDAGQDYEAEERARDSGIGTSYSERDSGALRRRTSKGRMGG